MNVESEIMSNKRPAGPRAPKQNAVKQLTFEDFAPDQDMNENQRAAQFIDWAARNMPKRFVPYVWITRHAYCKPKTPRIDNDEVNITRRKRMTRISQILWEKYHRRTVSAPRDLEPGVRGTTDSDDLAATDYLRRTKRVANGIKAVEETRSKIDTKLMLNKDMKALVERTDPIMKQLSRANLFEKLKLPPPKPDDD